MTPDLDAIQERIADCTSYNFGMHNANVLAKQDAPALVEEVERLQGIVDRVEGLKDIWFEALENPHHLVLFDEVITDLTDALEES